MHARSTRCCASCLQQPGCAGLQCLHDGCMLCFLILSVLLCADLFGPCLVVGVHRKPAHGRHRCTSQGPCNHSGGGELHCDLLLTQGCACLAVCMAGSTNLQPACPVCLDMPICALCCLCRSSSCVCPSSLMGATKGERVSSISP